MTAPLTIAITSATYDLLENGISGASSNHLLAFCEIATSCNDVFMLRLVMVAEAELKRRLECGDRMEHLTTAEKATIAAIN